jgi:hypothetical protein
MSARLLQSLLLLFGAFSASSQSQTDPGAELLQMEKLARAATATLSEARKPSDLDKPLEQINQLISRYPYDAGAPSRPASETAPRNLVAVASFTRRWQSLLAAELAGEKQEAVAILGELSAVQNVPAMANSTLIALRREAARRLGVPSIDDADKAVREAIEKAMKTSNAAELDATLEQLNTARNVSSRRSGGSGEERSPRTIFELGAKFIAEWQRYLVNRAVGETVDAKRAVEMLAHAAETEPLYPHARLLEALATADRPADALPGPKGDPAAKILAAIKSPDDIEANLDAFKKAAESELGKYHTVDDDLETLMKSVVALRHGDLGAASRGISGGFDRHPKVSELRAQVLIRVVAAMLRAEGDLAPKPGESAEQLARRVAADARDRKAWQRLREIVDAPLFNIGIRDVFSFGDKSAVRLFLAAQNLEAAGVWSEAVACYIAAMKTGSDYIPIETMKQQLEIIRRDHAAEYARGISRGDAAK